MFDPPVSTPISRITLIAASRMYWYSRSVSVCAGATVMESPVCTPMGSKFSIEQFMHRRKIQAARQDFQQLFAVVGNAAAAAAQRERRTDDERESDLAGKVQ